MREGPELEGEEGGAGDAVEEPPPRQFQKFMVEEEDERGRECYRDRWITSEGAVRRTSSLVEPPCTRCWRCI